MAWILVIALVALAAAVAAAARRGLANLQTLAIPVATFYQPMYSPKRGPE